MKVTLVGRPRHFSKTKSCVVVAMKGESPPTLPKGLPDVPEDSAYTFAVFISLRHWAKVEPVMGQDRGARLLVEGYPIWHPKHGIALVLANDVRTLRSGQPKASGRDA